MANALVVRTQRHKKIGDKTSPMVYTLKRKPKDAKMFDLERIAQDIEALGGMSAEDVVHVGKAIVRQMRQTMTDGNSVRLDGFGIFHTTFKCLATDAAKDCTVKNIKRVNIRFKVANTLRLVNDANATTKGGAISSIVPFCSHIDHTSHFVDAVITEYGVADLRGKCAMEKAAELVKVDNPDYRPHLHDYMKYAAQNGGHTHHCLSAAFAMHDTYLRKGDMRLTDWAEYVK